MKFDKVFRTPSCCITRVPLHIPVYCVLVIYLCLLQHNFSYMKAFILEFKIMLFYKIDSLQQRHLCVFSPFKRAL